MDFEETYLNEYQIDNEFLVPHGYLSDEEDDDPETVKQKQKLAAKEFEKDQKKKTKELNPRMWGTYWHGHGEDSSYSRKLDIIVQEFRGIVCGNNNLINNREMEGKYKMQLFLP